MLKRKSHIFVSVSIFVHTTYSCWVIVRRFVLGSLTVEFSGLSPFFPFLCPHQKKSQIQACPLPHHTQGLNKSQKDLAATKWIPAIISRPLDFLCMKRCTKTGTFRRQTENILLHGWDAGRSSPRHENKICFQLLVKHISYWSNIIHIYTSITYGYPKIPTWVYCFWATLYSYR